MQMFLASLLEHASSTLPRQKAFNLKSEILALLQTLMQHGVKKAQINFLLPHFQELTTQVLAI